MIQYRQLEKNELVRGLFGGFRRHQTVTDCFRRENGRWVVKAAPFIDDWSEADYEFLLKCLAGTIEGDGAVFGAFLEGTLKGFASVEGAPLGSRGQYLDLTSLHVSEDMRGHGIGRQLFSLAGRWAREHGAESLYISSHSAVETQAFYEAMGCVDAGELNEEHVRREPYDRQLECPLNQRAESVRLRFSDEEEET